MKSLGIACVGLAVALLFAAPAGGVNAVRAEALAIRGEKAP